MSETIKLRVERTTLDASNSTVIDVIQDIDVDPKNVYVNDVCLEDLLFSHKRQSKRSGVIA